MMEQIKPFSAITPEMIQDWKAKYGDVLSEVTVGDARFVVRVPGRRTIDLVAQYGAKKDIVAANNTIISNCVLGGDIDQLNEDGGVYQGLMSELKKLSEEKKATLKKL